MYVQLLKDVNNDVVIFTFSQMMQIYSMRIKASRYYKIG